MPNPRHRLTKEQRASLLDRLRAGEPGAALAREFGVTRQAVCFLRQHQDYREGLRDKLPSGKRPPKMKLTNDEWERVKQQLLRSKPADHGLHLIGDDPQQRWNLERSLELARLLTGRIPSKSKMKAVLMDTAPPPMPWWKRPEPPVRLTLDNLSESQRNDPELSAYLLSDVYWRIQQREYELAIEEHDRRGLDEGPPATAGDHHPEEDTSLLPAVPQPAFLPSPGQRVGKHKGGRNQPPKSKRKRKQKNKKRR